MKKWISLLLAGMLGLMTGCGSQEGPAADLTPVTLNEVAHSIFYAPQYVAIENGYFAEEGLDLTLVTGFGADKVATALVSGDADIGFMGSESSIRTPKTISSILPSSLSAPAISSWQENRWMTFNGKISKAPMYWGAEKAVCPRWSLNLS